VATAARAAPTLRRLVSAGVGQLLDEMAAAVPGLKLAIVDADGVAAHVSGGWPDGALDGLTVAGSPGPSGGDAVRFLDLVPRADRIGWLLAAGEAPAPLLEGLQRSISLLLREVLDKQDLARETLERYREINLLYRATETIGACLNADVVPRLLLAEIERVIPATVAAVVIDQPDAVGLAGAPKATQGWGQGDTRGTAEEVATLLRVAAGLIEQVRLTGRPDISVWSDVAPDSPQSAMCIPIRAGERVLGVVVLGRSDRLKVFTAGDEKLLLGLAGQAGIALERTRLYEQENRRLRLEEELSVARRIQLTLLPSHPPVVPGWSFAATYEAARQVGGDFYDFLDHALEARRMGLVIADVTGKGVPAALMMAYSRAVVRAESMAGRTPLEVLARTNRLIMQERQTRLFLSAFYAEFDLDSGRLTYANAGHDAPLLVEAGGRAIRELDAPGVILGAFHDIGLESREVQLAPGDTVVFYTDGVTEARDPEGRLFGDERLAAAATGAHGSAEAVLESVAAAVTAFTAGGAQADDLTIVVVQRDPDPLARGSSER
jgi:serine phosphatase RsbU (regulator of sigma subunit)